MKTIIKCILALLLVVSVGIAPAYADIVFNVSGETRDGLVDFEATLNIQGDLLTVNLQNISSEPTAQIASLLTSFYWDIYNGSSRPELTLQSAQGYVYSQNGDYDESHVALPDGADATALDDIWVAGSDKKDYTGLLNGWEFVQYDDPDLEPYYGFGIGTVGNHQLENNFNGGIVNGFDYGIYAGSIPDKKNFVDENLVNGEAIFVFSGLEGFNENDISVTALFGAGTQPDSTLEGNGTPTPVPIPSTALILFSGLAGIVGVRRKLRK